MEGEIHGESTIRIDGHFSGRLSTVGRLVIGVNGFVQGVIDCRDCELEGRIEGDITVNELLALKANSKLEGEVAYGKLAVEPGAVILGTCRLAGTQSVDMKAEQRDAAPLQKTA